tara:strand:- start:112 stop:303 length:192 start_codon:yes stop_codon:yes gene_type:complete
MITASHCPKCNEKLKVINSRKHSDYGFLTVKRRRACFFCDFKISTIEISLEIGNQIFIEEEQL